MVGKLILGEFGNQTWGLLDVFVCLTLWHIINFVASKDFYPTLQPKGRNTAHHTIWITAEIVRFRETRGRVDDDHEAAIGPIWIRKSFMQVDQEDKFQGILCKNQPCETIRKYFINAFFLHNPSDGAKRMGMGMHGSYVINWTDLGILGTCHLVFKFEGIAQIKCFLKLGICTHGQLPLFSHSESFSIAWEAQTS